MTYTGTHEDCRQIMARHLAEFTRSNRGGVFFYLARNPLARTPDEDYRLTVVHTDGEPARVPAAS